jgi:hypothetical protein
MAEIATIAAYAAIASSLIGTGVAVYSHVQQGKAAEATGKFNAKLAANESLRKEALARENIRRTREMNRRYLSTQKAQLAASGITLKGTPLAVLGNVASSLELEALDLAFNADQESRKLKSQAAMFKFEGAQTKKASNIQAGASLLSGLGTAAGQHSDAKSSGAI